MAIPKNWHRADIVAAIHKRGTSLSQLAKDNDKGESTLRAAMSHPRPPSNRIIAAFLGLQLHEIWPAWFDSKGRLRSRKPIRTRRRTSTQNRREKLSQPKLNLTGGRA